MALITISTTDLDGVTIKKVETEEGTIKVGAPGAEINTLDAQPEGTDEYYYTNENKYLQHVATGAVWQAQVMTKHQRAKPVNEDLGNLSFRYNSSLHLDSNGKSILLVSDIEELNYGNSKFLSNVDKDYVSANREISLSDYASTKAFNEATAGTSYTFTTLKRYATTEGHPVVKATDFSVPYPTLPYMEGEVKAEVQINLNGSFNVSVQNADLSESVKQVLRTTKFYETQVEVEYTIDKGDSNPITGTATTIANNMLRSNFLTEIGHTFTGSSQWTVTYKVKPFNFTWFEGNVTIVSDAVTQKIGDTL